MPVPFLTRAIPAFSKRLHRANRLGEQLANVCDRELLQHSLDLKYRVLEGESLRKLAPDAFALVREAAGRTLGQRHYDVQLLGGFHLVDGSIIEMETGQGKTLTATLALYLYALYGKGVHLATSNDYLAQRDAETMRPLYAALGLSTGFVVDGMQDDIRRQNYACDVTYGTCPQFGFDFLRDRIKQRQTNTPQSSTLNTIVQRPLFFALADEADALLIDEANTPLVIGVQGTVSESQSMLYQWASKRADVVAPNHYQYDLKTQQVTLTQAGRSWVRAEVAKATVACHSLLDLYEKVEDAILVRRDFAKDQQYILRDGEIVLINEATGRLGEGREWQDGIHQAIQALEGVPITAPTTNAAKLTVQSLFLSYKHLAGMTGTATAAARELRKVYSSRVVSIPTQQKSKRRGLPTRAFRTAAEKWQAICEEITHLNQSGRPVLIGTRSVEQSDKLSQMLDQAGVPHCVLNAREHAREAQIIAQAGQLGNVTVATSMAGRGTDIELCPEVITLGGLHVIVSELHDSPRQDHQLFGRCARQGQPGTYRQYLSMEDEILDSAYGAESAERMRQDAFGGLINSTEHILYTAQQVLEARRRKSRVAALYHDQRQLRSLWEMGRDPLLDAM